MGGSLPAEGPPLGAAVGPTGSGEPARPRPPKTRRPDVSGVADDALDDALDGADTAPLADRRAGVAPSRWSQSASAHWGVGQLFAALVAGMAQNPSIEDDLFT